VEFAPSVYEHAARLIGRTPWAVSRDQDLMVEGHARAWRLYSHAPVVVGIDIYNLEAEAYGAGVREPSGEGLPAVTDHPFRTAEELTVLPAPDPAADGRLPMIIAAGRRLAAELPGADVRIPVSGPFSIAAGLLGMDALLCEAIGRAEPTRQALVHLARNQAPLCRAAKAAGLDIAFFESAAAPPLLSPALFRAVELPALRTAIEEAAAIVGHPVPCIIGGDTTPILDAILEAGTGYVICPAETDQAEFMRRVWERTEVRVRINTRPEVIASGTWPQTRAEVDRVLALAAGRSNVCLGTGALPYETPPGNVLRMRDYIAEHS
jgi:uroporphyrinogen decarboxylase